MSWCTLNHRTYRGVSELTGTFLSQLCLSLPLDLLNDFLVLLLQRHKRREDDKTVVAEKKQNNNTSMMSNILTAPMQ